MSASDDLQCPRCGGRKIRERSTLASFLGWLCLLGLAVLGMWLFPAWMMDRENFHGALFIVLLTVGLLFPAVLASGLSALFDKNRCRECKHRWR